jgi:hypothetical protein
LAFGQSIYAVIEKQYVYIRVPPEEMKEVIAANGETVAIARHQPNGEFRVGDLHACGNGRCSSMNGMKTISIHIIRKPTGAANPADDHKIFLRYSKLGEGALYGVENSVIATTRAPPNIVGCNKIFFIESVFLFGQSRFHRDGERM